MLVLISVWLTIPSALEDGVTHVCPHSSSFFASFTTCCHEPCFAADSFLQCFLWGLKPKSCFSGGEQGAGFQQTGWEWEGNFPCTCPVCKTPCSATLYDARSLLWTQLLISFEIHRTSFWSFFPTRCEWNKLVLQSTADQHIYFPCSLLQATELNLLVSDRERKKRRKMGFKLTKRNSVIRYLWPKIQHQLGVLCSSSLANLLVSCIPDGGASGVGYSQFLQAVPWILSLWLAVELQTGKHLP